MKGKVGEGKGGGGGGGGGMYKQVHVNCMRMRGVTQVLALAIVIRI